MNRRLGDRRFLVLMIDGVDMAEYAVVVALGIDAEGSKHVLGLREGATENAPLCAGCSRTWWTGGSRRRMASWS